MADNPINITTPRMNDSEKQLQRRLLEMKTFINNLPDMAWLKDTDSQFIIANKAFGDVVGFTPEQLEGHTCTLCFGEKDAAKHRADDLRVMEAGVQQRIEEMIIGKDKNEIWLETIKSPIVDENGNKLGTVGIARDITIRKKAEQELEKMNKLMVDRELHMIELKKENEELKKQLAEVKDKPVN